MNLTFDIRKILYLSILKKNIGFFDFQENSTPVLSTIMQSDTSKINGAAADAVPPQLEGTSMLILGLGCALYFNWQMTVACIVITPLMFVP